MIIKPIGPNDIKLLVKYRIAYLAELTGKGSETMVQEKEQQTLEQELYFYFKEAKNRGISKISLHTTKAGEKLYRKFGFKEPVYPVLELPF